MRKIALGLALLSFAGSAAFAQTSMTFAEVDTDTSGDLSLEELQVVWSGVTQEQFDGADLDTSGGLNAEEVATLQQTMSTMAGMEGMTMIDAGGDDARDEASPSGGGESSSGVNDASNSQTPAVGN